MNERIKELRKTHLGLTQQEFADRIGVKRNTIATYETGRNEPIDAVISLICREFNVNENWLRTGEGDVFIKRGRIAEITEAVAKMAIENNPLKEKLVLALLRIPSDKWPLIEQAAREILAENEESQDN